MNVVLFGASGMVGAGVLRECLVDPRADSVLAIGRTPCGVTHGKLREIIRSDFLDFSDIRAELKGLDACFFCLGVSAAGKSEDAYRRLTYDLTMAAAHALAEDSPEMTFCYVSGEGTDSSERGRFMWARVKGKTENDLLSMNFKAYMFRPGFIQPMHGVRSKTAWYQAVYAVTTPIFPVLQRLLPAHMTTTENIGRAMIAVARQGYAKKVLENPDINAAAALP